MGRRFVFTPPSKRDKTSRSTKEEQECNELLSFMPEGMRKEYEKADQDQKKSIWEANKRAYEAANKRKEERLRAEQEHTAKALDLLQRAKEDPTKTHLLPPSDATTADLRKWYDEMQKPVRPMVFPSGGADGGARDGSSLDWTSTRKRQTPTDDDKTPLERFRELQKNAPPESDEDRALRKREELVAREEALQRQREMDDIHKIRHVSLWPGTDEQHARRMQAAFEGKPNSELPKPWHKHRDLVVGILLACGAAIMTIALLLLPIDNKARVVLLVLMFTLSSFSMALVMHYFNRLRLGIVVGILLSALWTSAFGWYVWPKPTPPQNDAVLSITDAVLPKETVIPFEAGKPIYVNLTIDNTGKNAAYNVREYGRMGFVSASSEKQEAEIEQLFAPILDESRTPTAKPGYNIPPSLRAAPTTTVYLTSHLPEDLKNFNDDRKRLCVILRLEYDDTKWTEACLVLNRDQLDNMMRGKQVMWSYCHSHNGSSRN